MDQLLLIPAELSHVLIGFYFAFFGIWNIYHWRPILLTMSEKNIPHPWLLLPLGIAWQTITGIMIICNIHIKIAALSLIPFTLIAVCIFHPFWRFKGELRVLNFNIFITNITITLASLLLLLTNILPLSQLSDLITG